MSLQSQDHLRLPVFCHGKRSIHTGTQCNREPSSGKTCHTSIVEELAVGILSGLAGGLLSWAANLLFPDSLSTLGGILYCLLFTCLLLEIWETWVLFTALCRNSKKRKKQRQIAHNQFLEWAQERKRLVRQLFGNGVIMGQIVMKASASLAVLQTSDDADTVWLLLLQLLAAYVAAWIGWAVVCQFLNNLAPPKERTLKRQIV
ncbi:expressed unknown protein [Seminavis robusta]|uniref:Transmembrane protein n=1 Tax=Seminavis robusta TaxID=568900 RepID=A0A9N8HTZ2_9STRA|nr:expressed unknown protein [Seminavis robusta]|eukprot:Sro1967_g308310.1 n/a (203) ;mRNA; f:1914-2522